MYKGNLVCLRAYEQDDVMYAHTFVNDYSTMKGVMSGILYPSSFEDEMMFKNNQTSYTSGAYQFAIETLEEKLFIGRCGFTRVDFKNRVGELGIVIGLNNFRGKGYGTDAVKTLIQFGFDELNLRKIKASVFDFNTPAIQSYQKCGMEIEGTLKQELYREGAYHDVVLLSIIRKDV